jgi:hypothetical protein
VYLGYPQIDEDQHSRLIKDFFIVAAGIQRLRATLTSVQSFAWNGPTRLLTFSTTRMVTFMDRNLEALAEHLGLVDVEDIRTDITAIRDMSS